MLADVVVSAGSDHSSPLCGVFERATQAVANAVRFVLEREVVAAAQIVSEALPSSILQGLPLCRLPYPTTWLEYAGHDRPEIAAIGTTIPHRVGLLCEAVAESPGEFTVNVFWHLGGRDNRVELCPVALLIDMTAEGRVARDPQSASQKRDATIEGLQKLLLSSTQRWDQKVAANPRELEAMLALSNRIFFIRSTYFAPVATAIVQHSGAGALERLLNLSRPNAEAEAGFLLAILMLLNSRNGTSREPADLAKINTARRKQGRHPLLDFCTVNLRLSASRSRALGRSDVPVHLMRAHLVRGHFKIRRSGIYWWSPHIRGDAKLGMIRKDYKVAL
ncbi:MAG: hypothetical protein E6Q98_01320 [Rhodospirillaceae bacterium]|nr:MAG: hypothetical protein E6Q98_01320 [Rhodospirillaceae bacterium]